MLHQHVEPTAMRHADHRFLHALRTRTLQQMLEQRDRGFSAFQRKTFLSDELGVQIALQRLRGGEEFEDAPALRGVITGQSAHAFQAILYPAFLRHIADVHVFRADAAAVSLAQQLEDLAQGHARATHQRAGIEGGVHIGLAQTVMRRVKLGDHRFGITVQRVEIGDTHAEKAMRVDELQHIDLFALNIGIRCDRIADRRFWQCGKGALDPAMCLVMHTVGQRGERIEITAPLFGHAVRISEILLIQLLDKRRIGSEQKRVALHQLHEIDRLVQRFPTGT